MKVYIAVDHDVESDEILGVYATPEAVERARTIGARGHGDKDEKGLMTAAHYLACDWLGASIEEWEVQE